MSNEMINHDTDADDESKSNTEEMADLEAKTDPHAMDEAQDMELVGAGEDDGIDPMDGDGDDDSDSYPEHDEPVEMIEGAIAHVSDLEHGAQSFPAGTTRREAIGSYLDVDPSTVESSGKVFRIVHLGEISDLDEPLKDGDVVTIYSRSVAKGGFPGGLSI